MRTGFEVVLEATGKAGFQSFSPQQSSEKSLITFAEDAVTGTAVVLIGRLYYQDDLKVRLPQKIQQSFPSDAALALTIFQHHGSKGLAWLEGEFALVAFDPVKRSLTAVRDPLGNWPLFWTYSNQTVRVSTNLHLLAGRLSQVSINLDFLASFLMFPFAGFELATEQTAFEQIRRILPGTTLVLHSDGVAMPMQSWDWMSQIQYVEKIEPEEAGLQFIQLFRESIKERIQFGKVASHLSGGMDSSSIVCIARELFASGAVSGQLATLSLVYQMPNLAGEKNYIQMVVDQGGAIEPHYLDGDAALDFEWFTEEIPAHDEPYGGLFHLAMEKVLVAVANQLGVTTILSGGGAELILESNQLYLADLLRQGHWSIALRDARQWAHAHNISLWSVLQESAITPLLPAFLREGIGTLLRRGYGNWPKLGLFNVPPWILHEFAQQYGLWNKALTTIRQLNRYPVEQSLIKFILQAGSGNWASWYLGAPQGIQIGQPFLDPRLIGYCLGLPNQLKNIPGARKPVLQSAMQGFLPEPIRTRQFQPSFNEVYWTGLSRNLPYLEDMVLHSNINDLGIFDKHQLIDMIRQHAIGIGDARSGISINKSLALIAWFDHLERALSLASRAVPKPLNAVCS